MGTVVEGTWRIKVTILMILFIICSYSASAMFSDDVIKTSYEINLEQNKITSTNNTTGNVVEWHDPTGLPDYTTADDFIGAILGVFNFLTFANFDNMYVRVIFTWVIGFSIMVLIYILYTYIKEWVPFN